MGITKREPTRTGVGGGGHGSCNNLEMLILTGRTQNQLILAGLVAGTGGGRA